MDCFSWRGKEHSTIQYSIIVDGCPHKQPRYILPQEQGGEGRGGNAQGNHTGFRGGDNATPPALPLPWPLPRYFPAPPRAFHRATCTWPPLPHQSTMDVSFGQFRHDRHATAADARGGGGQRTDSIRSCQLYRGFPPPPRNKTPPLLNPHERWFHR